MEFEKIDILELLPQKPPFVMVDRLLYCDRETTTTSFVVCEDCIFCDNRRLSAAGIAENIAQTCAARMGFINKYICHDEVKIGFIGAIRNQEFFRLPAVGETIVTQIDTVQEIFRTTLVNAKVSAGDEIISTCEMKIAITEKGV